MNLQSKWRFMQVIDGAVDALEAEAGSLNAADLYKRVLPFSGMGPFTAANVLQLLGMFLYTHEMQQSLPVLLWRRPIYTVSSAC